MKKRLSTIGLFCVSIAAVAANGPHWQYSGEDGPENWAKLSADYSACAGKNQSPVNLTGFIEAELKPIQFHYSAKTTEILNNGHTIQVNAAPGSNITLDGIQFDLKQFHFHAPSENRIHSKSYPLELHLVHADKDGNLAVVAVMFEQGKANSALTQAWAQLPTKAGDKLALDSINLADLLPKSRDYYRFNGSLTTPPCSEGVRWLVLKRSMSASAQQLQSFSQVLQHANNRPIQAINARTILQ